jgi:CHAT domain-containing protein/Tfp pilus assembly protein PilF
MPLKSSIHVMNREIGASMKSCARESITEAPRVLQLEAGFEGGRVRICLAVQNAGEVQTMRQVEDIDVDHGPIARRCRQMVAYINQANRRGTLSSGVLEQLQETGQLLRDDLFSATIKERLNAESGKTLILSIDEDLAHIPWELLHDGSRFFGQRFIIGRVVRTRQPLTSAAARPLSFPLNALVLVDPAGDLRAAYEEGLAIRDQMEVRADLLQTSFRSDGVGEEFLKAKLRRYDLVHFAGHVDPGKGWRLSREWLSARSVRAMAGTGSMPALVFANGCQSAGSRNTEAQGRFQSDLFDLASAFLLSGVKHYIGTFWDIPDEAGRLFALRFYQELLAGGSVGGAVHAARLSLIEQFGEASIIWAGYLLYGDPTKVYFPGTSDSVQPGGDQSVRPVRPSAGAAAQTRSPQDTHNPGKTQRRRGTWIPIAAAALLFAAVFGYAFLQRLPGPAEKGPVYAQEALTAFHAGRFEQVREICYRLQDQHPQQPLGFLLMANVCFYEGDLHKARTFYEQALQANRGPDMEKAEAFIGLGRIASVHGETGKALHYYDKAARLAPKNERPLVAQAVLLEETGKPERAAELLQKAKPMASDSQTLDAMLLQLQADQAAEADRQRQERVDRLIQELNHRLQEQIDGPATEVSQPGQEHPVTLWLADLETVGYSLREGTATLLTSGLQDRFLKAGRFRLVERSLLHRVMEEIRIGTSGLSAPSTRLQLGRLAAAHVILAGRVVHTGPALQVTLRCIESDTGQIFAVANGRFNERDPIADMVNLLAEDLIEKIQHRFAPRTEESESAYR